MGIWIALAGLCFGLNVIASSDLEEAADFLSWLEKNATEFSKCEPTKNGGKYVLCDQTKVDQAELKALFAMTPEILISKLRTKNLRVELICGSEKKNRIPGLACAKESSNQAFTQVTSLHGKYLPNEKTILIRNSASSGSLIHEYIHSLQSENENKIYGRVYKKSRNEVQKRLTNLMDKKIATVQELEKKGKKEEAKSHIQEFMLASDAMRAFATWQDLIDERSIFLLYLKFGREFGATNEDLALAKKNMEFICKNPKLTRVLPKKQCL